MMLLDEADLAEDTPVEANETTEKVEENPQKVDQPKVEEPQDEDKKFLEYLNKKRTYQVQWRICRSERP